MWMMSDCTRDHMAAKRTGLVTSTYRSPKEPARLRCMPIVASRMNGSGGMANIARAMHSGTMMAAAVAAMMPKTSEITARTAAPRIGNRL